MMNAPMNRNISGSANGANTSLAGATRNTTHAAAASSAVTGIGSASVTHSTITAAITAANRWASSRSSGHGQNHTAAKASGAKPKPRRCRQRSKARSLALRGSGGKGSGGMGRFYDFRF